MFNFTAINKMKNDKYSVKQYELQKGKFDSIYAPSFFINTLFLERIENTNTGEVNSICLFNGTVKQGVDCNTISFTIFATFTT